MFTPEEKETFLALIRVGHDSAQAARLVNQEYTGSMFRRLTNESSTSYDPDFAAEYLRARAEGGRNDKQNRDLASRPRTTTMSGHVKANYLTPEMLDQFLESVSNGVPLVKACDEIEPKTSLTQISRRANRDPEFAQAYADAKEAGYPVFIENLRNEAIRQAYNGDYRALRDQLLIHDPEFRRVLLAQKHEISGTGGEAIRLLAEKALPELPTEKIKELVKYIEDKQLGKGKAEAA